MSNAVTKIDLMDDGKTVSLHFGKMGKSKTVAIKDIVKQENESKLVETFEEGTMFPIQVAGKTYYINGNGQEAIKSGEIFRAIVNG